MWMQFRKNFFFFGIFSLALASCAGNEDAELTDILTPDQLSEEIQKSGDPGEDLNEPPLDPEAQDLDSQETAGEPNAHQGDSNENDSPNQNMADRSESPDDLIDQPVQEDDSESVALPKKDDQEQAQEPIKKRPNGREFEIDDNVPSFLRAHAFKNRMVVVVDKSLQKAFWIEKGKLTNQYKISSGDRGYDTPVGTYPITRMHARYVSKQYKARMDDAIFFYEGYAIHATYGKNIKLLGPRSDAKGFGYSYGCVRQSPENADDLFHRVKFHGAKNVNIVVQD